MQSGARTQAGYTAPLCAHMASSLGAPFGRRGISPTQAAGSDARLCALWEPLSHWKTWTWLWKVHCGVSRLRGMGCMTSCRRSFPPRSYDLMWLRPKRHSKQSAQHRGRQVLSAALLKDPSPSACRSPCTGHMHTTALGRLAVDPSSHPA